uniref:Larval cuticle protein LCP-17 n=1 Tax=Timema bartmani TaxID=61472 RepID=A0A7R9F1J9_9NEOP|nr:unnamed protein product [Timema bartmani]
MPILRLMQQASERSHHLPTRESPRTHLYKSYLIKEQRRGEVDQLIISCLLAAALAAPPQLKLAPNEPIPILAQSNIVNEDGTFQNSYESADGTRAESSGSLKSLGPQEEGQVIQGSYSFYTPDGQLYELRYIADENGFQPQGNFLPVAPPIPEEILKSLAYNAAHPEEDNLRK